MPVDVGVATLLADLQGLGVFGVVLHVQQLGGLQMLKEVCCSRARTCGRKGLSLLSSEGWILIFSRESPYVGMYHTLEA